VESLRAQGFLMKDDCEIDCCAGHKKGSIA
jgi:hypothetical protein